MFIDTRQLAYRETMNFLGGGEGGRLKFKGAQERDNPPRRVGFEWNTQVLATPPRSRYFIPVNSVQN